MATLVEIALSNAVAATVVAVVAAVVTICCRRPALAHGVWLLVLIKLVTPAFVPVSVSWPHPEPDAASPVAASAEAGAPPLPMPDLPEAGPAPSGEIETMIVVVPPALQPPPPAPGQEETSWLSSLLALWLGGSALWFAWTGFSIIRFRRLLRYARPAPARLCQHITRLAEQMGLRNTPRVALLGGAVSPMIWAAGRTPTLLFPAHLLERLDEQQLRTLLAHELAHVRRGDHRVRLLEWIVTGLYWWHPVVWWARREIHEAEEQCCDAWVVSTVDSGGRTYAIALLQAIAFVSKARAVLPATASGIGQVPHLRRRLTMILETRTPRSLSWTGWAGLCGIGLLLLPLVPVRAQQPTPEKPAATPDQADQQRIEKAVRKAMEYLAQDQQAGAKKSTAKSKKDSKAIQKAQAEVESANATVQQAQASLKAAEARLAEAQSRLARLQGKPTLRWVYQTTSVPGQVGNGKGTAYVIVEDHGNGTTTARTFKRGQVRITQPPTASVEDKLDRLQREIEELRKEMKRQRSGNSAQRFRFGSFSVPPTGVVAAPGATPPVPAAPAAPAVPSILPGVILPPAGSVPAAPAAPPLPATRP